MRFWEVNERGELLDLSKSIKVWRPPDFSLWTAAEFYSKCENARYFFRQWKYLGNT